MSTHGSQEPLQEFLNRLSDRVDDISRRLERLEFQAGVKPAPPPPLEIEPAPPKASSAPPSQPPVPPAPIIPPPPQIPDTQPSPEPTLRPVGRYPSASAATGSPAASAWTSRWESVVGGQWTLWIGSLFVFLAVALFLQWAWQQWGGSRLGPAGRVAIGFAIGSVFVVGAALSARRQQKWFVEGITGAGLAIYYLTIWAAAEKYALFSFEIAFALMALTTAAGVFLAVRYDALSLCVLATAGGFLTPAVLSPGHGGASNAVPLLIYVAVLNAGIASASLFKRWRGVIYLSFIGTLMLIGGWSISSYRREMPWTVFGFLTLYELEFIACASFYSLWRREQTPVKDLALLFAATFFYGSFSYSVIRTSLGVWPGAFPLLTAVAFAALAGVVHAVAHADSALRRSLMGLSVFFVTTAIAVQLKASWLAVAWSLEAALLVTMAVSLDSQLFRRSGQVVWALALIRLVFATDYGNDIALDRFLGDPALPVFAGALATAWIAVLEARLARGKSQSAFQFFSIATIALTAWLLNLVASVIVQRLPAVSAADHSAVTTFLTAILWAIFAVAIDQLGSSARRPFIRLCGLVVVALAAALPVGGAIALWDLRWQPFWNVRAASFLVTLLALGWLGWRLSRDGDENAPRVGPWATGWLSLIALVGASIEVYSGGLSFSHAGELFRNATATLALCCFWTAYAIAMLWLGLKWRQPALGVIGLLVTALALAVLFMESAQGLRYGPIWNVRFAAFLWVAASLAVMARIVGARMAGFDGLATLALLGALFVLVWGLTQETYQAFRFHQAHFPDWEIAAQMAVSLVWTVVGVAVLVSGAHWNSRPLRLVALSLLGLTACKLFLLDLGFLEGGYRIVTFAGLGVALIGISWLYSHYEIGRESTSAAT